LEHAGRSSHVKEEAARMDTALTVSPAGTAAALLLRPWTEEDIPAMLAAHQDPAMRRWLRHPITDAEQARQLVQARQADRRAGTGFSFAVLETADGLPGTLVGHVSIRGLGAGAATGEVGYWVASFARGRGIAPRALSVVCDWAFRSPQIAALERLQLIHTVGNEASCRVAEKAKFTLSAVLPPLPPEFPQDGHLHVRPRAEAA
jgi:RimJ/RimL family protein N-acetyltransferase